MEFKKMTHQEKLDYIKAKPDKMKKNDKGEILTAEEIKNRLIDIRNYRLQMTIEEGEDPLGKLSIKQQIEDIDIINKQEVGFFELIQENPV